MENKLVSIIVPVFNAGKYLENLILSLMNQTYHNIEIIFIDDGSTDNSRNIVNKYCKKDSRITKIFTENSGVSSARNRGLDIASGDYICFIDADDYLEDIYVEKLLNGVRNNNVQLAICDYWLVYGKKKKTDNNLKSISTVNSSVIIKEVLLSDNYIKGFVWNKIFDAQIIKEHSIKFNDKSFILEDMEFLIKYLCHIESIYLIHQQLYNYVQHSNSATRKIDDKYMSAFNVIDNFKIILNYNYDPYLKVLYYEFYANVFKYHIKNKRFSKPEFLSRGECLSSYYLLVKLKKNRSYIQKIKDIITILLIISCMR
ncbi:glycosyltransferase [Enterococcus faecium]|nr:glycosyltransferase [Enterococcus faecium]